MSRAKPSETNHASGDYSADRVPSSSDERVPEASFATSYVQISAVFIGITSSVQSNSGW